MSEVPVIVQPGLYALMLVRLRVAAALHGVWLIPEEEEEVGGGGYTANKAQVTPSNCLQQGGALCSELGSSWKRYLMIDPLTAQCQGDPFKGLHLSP